MKLVKTIVNRKWWWQTLLVLVGMVILAELGFWQLDRLAQRRAFNARLIAQWDQQPFDLNQEDLPADVVDLEWRRVKAQGQFDYEHQIILTNQPRDDGSTGVMLVTPLILADNRAVLVARGWVPYGQSGDNNWRQYDEPSAASVVGLIQESHTLPETPISTTFQSDWYRVDIPAIQHQMPYPLLPAFLMQLPEPGRKMDALPLREIPAYVQMPDEGNHLSYAIQWFMFAVIFGFGYLQFVRTQEMKQERLRGEAQLREATDGVNG
ncbi:MAG: SURF1 family protein [Caldilineaceae bacterium]